VVFVVDKRWSLLSVVVLTAFDFYYPVVGLMILLPPLHPCGWLKLPLRVYEKMTPFIVLQEKKEITIDKRRFFVCRQSSA